MLTSCSFISACSFVTRADAFGWDLPDFVSPELNAFELYSSYTSLVSGDLVTGFLGEMSSSLS